MAIPITALPAGHKPTAAELKQITDALTGPVDDTTIGTAQTNFTDAGCEVKTLLDGYLIFMRIVVTNTNAITATSGDFTDIGIFTVDAAYRPTAVINAVWGNGHTTGEAILQADGQVILRAASDSISASTTIRVTFCFIHD